MPELNVASLEQVMKDFYTATHFRIGLLDCNMQEKLSYPKEKAPFCTLIRENSDLDEQCRHCDQAAFQKCANLQEPLIYRCHAGLMEVITPVRDEDRILCYIMFGQIISNEDIELQRKEIYERFKDRGLDDSALRQAIEKIRPRSSEQIKACATIAASLVLFILKNQMVKPDKARFIEMLNNYIDCKMDRQITVNDLCSYFYVSRSRLYNIAQPYLSCSLSEYILRRKIRQAQVLLEAGEKTVSQIAEETGFSDVSYFRRVFKKKTGYTVKEYCLANIRGEKIL